MKRSSWPGTAAVCLAAVAALAGPPAGAVLNRVLGQAAPESVLEGTLAGASVDDQGWIRAALAMKQQAELGDPLVLAAASARAGTYLATGNDGRIYRLSAGRDEPELVFDSPETLIVCLRPDGDGVLAGTGPGGLVYRIDGKGEARTLARTGCGLVTVLAHDAHGRLLAATADPGRVLRIGSGGELETLYSAAEGEDVTDLAVLGERILAGTSGSGLLVEVGAGGAGRVLYQAAQVEIAPLAPLAGGGLLFAAGPRDLEPPEEAPAENGRAGLPRRPGRTEDGRTGTSASGLAAPPPERCQDPNQAVLYRMDRNGVVRPLWLAPRAPIFGLVEWGEDVLVASGMDGRLHLVHQSGRADVLREPLDAPISVLVAAAGGGCLAATSHPARVYAIGPEREAGGEYLSPAFDAGGTALWGHLDWDAAPGNPVAGVKFETRSGNRAEPDDGWSAWQPVEGDPPAAIASPPARFLQWRITLAPGAAVRNARAVCLPPNAPPVLSDLIVHPQAMGVFERDEGMGQRQLTQQLPGGLRIEYRFQGEPGMSKGRWLRLKGMRTVGWSGRDPDGDELAYGLAIRPLGGDWIELEPAYREDIYSFDTVGFADGIYEFRVEAADSSANPPDRAAADVLVSLPFTIDNTAPEVVAARARKTAAGGLSVVCQVRDAASAIRAAAHAVNGEEWVVLLPVDQIFDERAEEFAFELPPAAPAIESVVLRVADEAENVTVVRIPVEP